MSSGPNSESSKITFSNLKNSDNFANPNFLE